MLLVPRLPELRIHVYSDLNRLSLPALDIRVRGQGFHTQGIFQ